jgi:hypothetical protein
MTELREGGMDEGGSFVEYVYEGRREQGWVARLLDHDLVQIETFSGDYGVLHWVKRAGIRHVITAAEIAEANRP